jgi:hypothetical protein
MEEEENGLYRDGVGGRIVGNWLPTEIPLPTIILVLSARRWHKSFLVTLPLPPKFPGIRRAMGPFKQN